MKEKTDIHESLKKEGFIFRPPDKNHPKYKCAYLYDNWKIDFTKKK